VQPCRRRSGPGERQRRVRHFVPAMSKQVSRNKPENPKVFHRAVRRSSLQLNRVPLCHPKCPIELHVCRRKPLRLFLDGIGWDGRWFRLGGDGRWQKPTAATLPVAEMAPTARVDCLRAFRNIVKEVSGGQPGTGEQLQAGCN
jgi:hypothetical protein